MTPDHAGPRRQAIKTTLQKAAIHRDRRDRRRTTLFSAIRLRRHAESIAYPRYPAQITMIPAISSRNHRFPPATLTTWSEIPGSTPLAPGYPLS